MSSQPTSDQTELSSPAEVINSVSEHSNTQVALTNGSQGPKPKLTPPVLSQNPHAANGLQNLRLIIPSDSQSQQTSSQRSTNHTSTGESSNNVTHNGLATRAITPMQKPPDVVLRTVPGRSRNHNVSMIPRPKNTIRTPVPNQVRVFDAVNSQWHSIEFSENDNNNSNNNNGNNVGSASKKAVTSIAKESTDQFKTNLNMVGETFTFTQPYKQPSSGSSSLASKDATVQSAPRALPVKVTPKEVNTDSNRVTIVHADTNDTTVNSELSDFEDEQHVQNYSDSVWLYPKLLNERTLAPMSEQSRDWTGPDRNLTFVPHRPGYNVPINYAYGNFYNSFSNLAPSHQSEYHHPIRRTNEYTAMYPQKPHGQMRYSKHNNQYKSTPDIFNSGRVLNHSKIPYRSVPYEMNAPYSNGSGPSPSFAYGRGPSFIPNTIIEADDGSDEEPSDLNANSSGLFIDSNQSRPYQHFDFSFVPNSFDNASGRRSGMGYHSMTTRADSNPRPNKHSARYMSMENFGSAMDENDDLMIYDESSIYSVSGSDKYRQSPNLSKSVKTLAVDHRLRDIPMRRNRIGSTDALIQPTRRKSSRPESFDPSAFEPRAFSRDFDPNDPRWRLKAKTTEPDYHTRGTKARRTPVSSPFLDSTHGLMDDQGYPRGQKQRIDSSNQSYQRRDPVARRAGQPRVPPVPFGPRPRSLCDNLALFRSSPDLAVGVTQPYPITMMQECAPKMTKPYVKREANSEWDLSRLGFDQPGHADLHPDSYIHTRPNIRRGFGGNYTRPNAGPPRLGSSNQLNRPGRSLSLERTSGRVHVTPTNESTERLLQAPPIPPSSSLSTPHHRRSSQHSSSATSSVSSQSNVPIRLDNSTQLSSSNSRTNTGNTLSNPRSKIANHRCSPPPIVWREKTERERQSDEKLRRLIRQLPLERQHTISFVLLMMGINANENGGCRGLEARLRDALQLMAPDSSSTDSKDSGQVNEPAVVDGTGDSAKGETVMNGHANFSDSTEDIDEVVDPRMTQSCYQPNSNTPLNSHAGKQTAKKSTINGHAAGSLSTELNTSNESISDAGLSSETPGDNQPSLATVLRRLARCLAVRLACKRHHLANAQQRVARNSTEEKWLRNKLTELFTGGDHNSSSNSFSYSQTAMDSAETPVGNVVARFDRWHNNTIAAVELLCQLARRLAYLDARIKCLSFQPQRESMWNNSALRTDPQESLEELRLHQTQLQAQIREAQELRATQENCRQRLLDSIPPGLKLLDAPSFFSSSSKPPNPAIASNGTNGNKPSDDTVNSTTVLENSSTTPIFLRDRVALHLTSTVQWLVTFHVLDTEIRMDQDIWDNIQDEQRLEVNY